MNNFLKCSNTSHSLVGHNIRVHPSQLSEDGFFTAIPAEVTPEGHVTWKVFHIPKCI